LSCSCEVLTMLHHSLDPVGPNVRMVAPSHVH